MLEFLLCLSDQIEKHEIKREKGCMLMDLQFKKGNENKVHLQISIR